MKLKMKQFETKYTKSYKTLENAEKAVNKFFKDNEEWMKEWDSVLKWIPTIAEDKPDRIVPVFVVGTSLMNKGFNPMWIVEKGFSVIG